ncbi:DUF6925 family protein [Methylobacterium marchantiae]|uniref:DUF6925 family protein n=1 Tax=Methylobacterium marchantiae TaxID=600331 RepID=A0ABW3WWW0_9HYPH|nr:hypothetical protein AIGOOFII_1314 [Methylobacterium marchantiae]
MEHETEAGILASPSSDRLRASAVSDFLADCLRDPSTTWSLGSFGAIAAFLRDPEEEAIPLHDARLGLVTPRGAIALDSSAGLRPVPYETGFASDWNHAVAMCLPRESCAMNRRSVITELGPDRDAAGIEDRDGILFDLGLKLLAVDACVRTQDARTIALLRDACGHPLFGSDETIARHLVAASPHRVFATRIGRIEVFTPIPPATGTGSSGPHSHILPDILRLGRTHAATAPIPSGWVPCGAIHPPHPCKDIRGRRIPFRRERHDAFQALLARWGDPDLFAAKTGSTRAGRAAGRHARSARRAAEAQAGYLRDTSIG